jgi:cytochrome c oxidase subunit IV
LIPGRSWGVFFAIVTIGFITDTYRVIKGMRKERMGLLDVLMNLSLPYFMLLMWNENLTMGEIIIDSIIPFVCVVSGILHIDVLRKKMIPPKKERYHELWIAALSFDFKSSTGSPGRFSPLGR